MLIKTGGGGGGEGGEREAEREEGREGWREEGTDIFTQRKRGYVSTHRPVCM